MDTRTYDEKMDNIKKYEDSELFVRDYLNSVEGKGHEKVYGPFTDWDISGPKNYEVKTYKVGKHPCITKDCYIQSKADYIAFVEVDEQAAPTGKLIICVWKDLRTKITGDMVKGNWVQLEGRRYVWFIKENILLVYPWAIDVTGNQKEKIDDLLSFKSVDYLRSN